MNKLNVVNTVKIDLEKRFNNGEYSKILPVLLNKLRKHQNDAFYNNLVGCCYVKLNMPEKALRFLERANNFSTEVQYYENLNLCLLKLNREKQVFQNLSAFLQSDYTRSLFLIFSQAVQKLNSWSAALETSRKALTLDDTFDVQHTCAIIFMKSGDLEQAIQIRERILNVHPENSTNIKLLAEMCLHSGKTEKAKTFYQMAINIQPDDANSHRMLASIEKKSASSKIMEDLLTIVSTSPDLEKRVHAAFAIGDQARKFKDFETSFRYIQIGNQIEWEKRQFDVGIPINRCRLIKEEFSENLPNIIGKQKLKKIKANGLSPILIVGMPRSGTTLTEQILASHSQVFGAGELSALQMSVLDAEHTTILGHENPFMAKCETVNDNYISRLKNLEFSEQFVVDKLPQNFVYIGYLLAANPNVKVVNLSRNHMAVAWSIYKKYFPADGMGYSFNMQAIYLYYQLYIEMMKFWHELFPNRILDFDYENLVNNQLNMTNILLNFCGLQFENACLDFHKTKRSIKTSSASQVVENMYQNSSLEWEKYADYLHPFPEMFEKLDRIS